DEGAQAKFVRNDERLTVRNLAFFKMWGIAAAEDVPEEAEAAGLQFPLTEFVSDVEPPLCEPRGFFGAVKDEISAAEKQEREAIQGTLWSLAKAVPWHRVEQGSRISGPTEDGIGESEDRGGPTYVQRNVAGSAQVEAALQEPYGFVDCSTSDIKGAE